MKYTIRLEKTIQESRFEPFRAEFTGEYDSEFLKYEDAIQQSLDNLDRILATRVMQREKAKK